MLLYWSTNPWSERKDVDEKVVYTLLMSTVSAEELRLGKVKEPLKMFIEGLFLDTNYIVTILNTRIGFQKLFFSPQTFFGLV